MLSSNQNKYKNLTWKSGNKKIVKIIGNKKIKGVKKGKVYIRGYNSRKKKVLAIRVTVGKKVSKINVKSTTVNMYVGDKAALNAAAAPASASNKKLFYSSSNPAVAKVSKNGRVTAVLSGSSVITIQSKDGHAVKKIKIKVQSELVRSTSKGKVKGIEDANGKSLVWYGVPYGASTAGNNRWKAPQPVAAWSGTRSATAAKQPAAQYSDGTTYLGTEDCLYVNVYRPNNGKKNLPVMVYLHGGGNASGSSDVSFSNMVSATNAIVVSVEYRLGAFGYLSHPALRNGTEEENSGNFTLLDVKAALIWVRDEIRNFGGNPGNVTLSGFSAGGRNALLCMISPGMRGLFHKAIIFSGGCNTCTNEEGEESVEEKLAAGMPYVIRQNNPTEGTTTFQDDIYGAITVDNGELDDMILIKSDGYPTYNFANVVDDHLMGITHVVRGNEYLSSSPKYNRLYEAFGWEVPVYVHCPLITDEEHKKLSKRCGHCSFEDLLEQGFLPETIINFVALLGWSPEEDREIYSLEELIQVFDYHHMSKAPSVFDYTKLKWMNGEYLKAMDFDKFYEMALPYLKEAITKDCDLKKIAAMVKTRIEVFPDIPSLVDFFEELPEYDTSMYAHKKMKTTPESSLEVLRELLPLLEAQEDYGNDALYALLMDYVAKKGCKNGFVLWPVRTAVSGKQMTPCGATEMMEIVGKEESLKRIQKAIEMLEKDNL